MHEKSVFSFLICENDLKLKDWNENDVKYASCWQTLSANLLYHHSILFINIKSIKNVHWHLKDQRFNNRMWLRNVWFYCWCSNTDRRRQRISGRRQIGDKTRSGVTEIIKTKRFRSVTWHHHRSASCVTMWPSHTQTHSQCWGSNFKAQNYIKLSAKLQSGCLKKTS